MGSWFVCLSLYIYFAQRAHQWLLSFISFDFYRCDVGGFRSVSLGVYLKFFFGGANASDRDCFILIAAEDWVHDSKSADPATYYFEFDFIIDILSSCSSDPDFISSDFNISRFACPRPVNPALLLFTHCSDSERRVLTLYKHHFYHIKVASRCCGVPLRTILGCIHIHPVFPFVLARSAFILYF